MDIDHLDRKILKQLQISSDISLDRLGEMVGLSRNVVWRRVRALETLVLSHVASRWSIPKNWILVCWCSFKSKQHSIRLNGPSNPWISKMVKTAQGIAQIIGLYRMSGDLDYLIKARVRDISDYDRLYQRLIKGLPLMDVSASFVTESLKDTAEIPVFI